VLRVSPDILLRLARLDLRFQVSAIGCQVLACSLQEGVIPDVAKALT